MTVSLTRGDIVLVPFPFTDLTSAKVRPAVIVNVVGEDLLVAFISSVIFSSHPGPTDFVLPETHPDFSKTGLKRAGTFKLAKLLCLHQSLTLRRLGHVSPAIQRELDVKLAKAVGIA